MALVGYSDSEGSDSESAPVQVTSASSKSTSKATDKKPIPRIVDRSNPHKIRVNLPSISQPEAQNDEERPAKKPRLGGKGSGLLGDLNSFLPAPKRSGTGANEAGTSQEKTAANGEKKVLGKGKPLGSGINLKTGAAPAFSREPVESHLGDGPGDDVPAEKATLPEEVKIIGKATIFKPLSVAKKTKKKTITNRTATAIVVDPTTANVKQVDTISTTATAAKPKPKVSLFSMSQDNNNDVVLPTVEDEPPEALPDPDDEFTSYDYTTAQEVSLQNSIPTSQSQSQSLSDLATTMNLDAASRRQLFGRNAKESAIKVLHFDTDAQYAENERLRATGETVQQNPFKAIQPGRHTLRQLVSAATTQKEALEQKWAEGKAKQGDAANRYGWR